MKISWRLSKVWILLILSFTFLTPAMASNDKGNILIANRASGDVSIIDVNTDTVTKTVDLSVGASNPAQPMYVVHTPSAGRVFIGDRGNDRVVVLDDRNFNIETSIPTGAGVFHMWADAVDRQLWVNNDMDNTITVIDPVTLEVINTVPIPADLVAMGGKPHDVVLDVAMRAAYVSIVGVTGVNDYIVKFDTSDFVETARAAVGKDPHVSITQRNKNLYVPTQNSNAIFILSKLDLGLVEMVSVPAAHGAGMAFNGKTFYTTNIAGGGSNGLYTLDTKTNTLVGDAVDTPFATPHNIALSGQAKKLYVTHSGAASDKVSVFNFNKGSRLPVFVTDVTVGFNPFGLAYVR